MNNTSNGGSIINLPYTNPLDYYKEFYKSVLHTGSRAIVNEKYWKEYPPGDDDYLVLVDKSVVKDLEGYLIMDGFIGGGSFGPNPENDTLFHSWKLDQDGSILNLIITWNQEFFDTFTKSTKLARALNLVRKEDRIILFEAINRNKWPE